MSFIVIFGIGYSKKWKSGFLKIGCVHNCPIVFPLAEENYRENRKTCQKTSTTTRHDYATVCCYTCKSRNTRRRYKSKQMHTICKTNTSFAAFGI